jgi:hypothetical protein
LDICPKLEGLIEQKRQDRLREEESQKRLREEESQKRLRAAEWLRRKIEEERQKSTREERLQRLRLRQAEAEQLRNAFLDKHLSPEYAAERLPYYIFYNLPMICALLEEEDAFVPVTMERLDTIADAFKDIVRCHDEMVQKRLLRVLANNGFAGSPRGVYGASLDDTSADPDAEVNMDNFLNKAWAILVCQSCFTLMPARDMLSHPDFLENTWDSVMSPHNNTSAAARSDNTPQVARMILAKCGLSEDTSVAEAERLRGRFICRCGDPTYEGVDFLLAVRLLSRSLSLLMADDRCRYII